MTTDTSTAASASPARTKTAGHLSAIFTIVVWGTTFISTKVLLDAFPPLRSCSSALSSAILPCGASAHGSCT